MADTSQVAIQDHEGTSESPAVAEAKKALRKWGVELEETEITIQTVGDVNALNQGEFFFSSSSYRNLVLALKEGPDGISVIIGDPTQYDQGVAVLPFSVFINFIMSGDILVECGTSFNDVNLKELYPTVYQ
ncbi:MAG: hypothetical protein UT34_C0001G0312 [candidate division WS6 bacterium GW2011_GWF2_39_15]|uniref:Uncharacterized protein n=1 Tax=candidate division WS6 bacterium GW2011_GWF2_39_15 TaxID=1619100 RepID=A0A0G0QXC8_9BACT|nr:MAG: hypothetical protein UT34_C0001G0312 [candidate division WS6 bacterium GW2011_GWF2_39_15]